jgi:acyl carrier protein
MNEAELRERLLAILGAIAPEARDTELDPAAPLRDQIDIDSMDFLNFVTAVHKQLGVPIPELDYPRLSSLDGAVHYVMAKLAV